MCNALLTALWGVPVAQVTSNRKYVVEVIPESEKVLDVAPLMAVQVALSDDDCHWKVILLLAV